MIGVIVGLIAGSAFSYFGDASWWWLFAWGFGGLFVELGIRVGAGEEVGDAVGNIASLGVDYYSGGESVSDCGSGD